MEMHRNEGMESITDRLSSIDNLYFPRALQQSAVTPPQRKSILRDLLSRDVAVFLERYGSRLTADELGEFDALNNNYEINWHLKELKKKINPTREELRSKSVTVRNRRLAYLNKLVAEGQYFSEDAMRDREPYLHHEYVGKFQDLRARNMARPGERWSETLMRRSEEARLVARIREEQQRLGVAERDWIGNENVEEEREEEEEETETETEEDEEEEEEENERSKNPICASHPIEANGAQPTTTEHGEGATISAEEMQDMMDQFTHVMQQKFLSGEDLDHLDYSKIDEDETLDDHWLREVGLDAEDKYFAED